MQKTIPLFKPYITQEAITNMTQVMQSGFIGLGPQVEKFENLLRSYIGYKNLVTTNSCTSALHLSYRLAGVGPSQYVILSPLTFFATTIPALSSFSRIIWADVNPNTCNIDIDDVVEKVGDHISAISFVHWGGLPVDVRMLRLKVTLKLGYCPPIIEDCAHAMGATYNNGAYVGTSGNFCAFSFQAIKHLTTIDGGMLTLPDEELYEKAKLIRWFGIDRSDRGKVDFRSEAPIEHWGYKFNMNDVNAAVGIANLHDLNWVLETHRDNANYYLRELQNIPGITHFEVPEGSDPSWWLFTMKVERQQDFIKMMKSKGVITSRVHERNDHHPCVERFKRELPKLDSFNDSIVCLPVGWWVTEEDRQYIVQCIKEGW